MLRCVSVKESKSSSWAPINSYTWLVWFLGSWYSTFAVPLSSFTCPASFTGLDACFSWNKILKWTSISLNQVFIVGASLSSSFFVLVFYFDFPANLWFPNFIALDFWNGVLDFQNGIDTDLIHVTASVVVDQKYLRPDTQTYIMA